MPSPAPSTYRERLRLEGGVLALCGLVGSALLLRLSDQSRRWPLSTVVQLLLVIGLLSRKAPQTAAKALEKSQRVDAAEIGTGEPTPLWMLPVVVVSLALTVVRAFGPVPDRLRERAGWDAALRVTGGSALVGLFQALVVERIVASDEEATGRTYYRLAGSKLATGTRLGYTDKQPEA